MQSSHIPLDFYSWIVYNSHVYLRMAQGPHWQEPLGLATINTIVKKLISRWTSGLLLATCSLVSAILDREDILCCTATGDGKSAAFSVRASHCNCKHTAIQVFYTGTHTVPFGLAVHYLTAVTNMAIYHIDQFNLLL